VFEPVDRFSAVNGGYDLIGYPLAPPHPFGRGVRQCFTNSCLYYDPMLSEEHQVTLLPVGRYYWEGFHDKTLTNLVLSPSGTTLKLALATRNLIPGQPLKVCAYLAILGEPAPERILRLTIRINDQVVGSELEAKTDYNGLVAFTVSPENPPAGLKLGTAIEVKVCYAGVPGGDPVCASDVIFLWDEP